MKKKSSHKKISPKGLKSKIPQLLPAGMTEYLGSVKNLEKWFAIGELETSGGVRSQPHAAPVPER